MTSLLDLPNELLSEIIHHLQLEQSHLWGLAHVNHRLHDVVQPFLFRYANDLSSHQLVLIKRSLKEKSDLRKAIWWYGPIDAEPDGYVSLEHFYVVPGLVNLKKLQFRIIKYRSHSGQSQQSLFQWDILEQVEEIELAADEHSFFAPPGTLIDLFRKLPSVHTVTVTGISIDPTPVITLLHAYRWFKRRGVKVNHTLPGANTLKLIGVENTILDTHIGLGPFLQPCTNLTTLHCTDMFVCAQRSGFPRGQTVFGRGQIQDALRYIEATLQELVLTVGGDVNTIFLGQPLDLSRFLRLSKLRLSYTLLKGWDVAESILYTWLPPNLETLRIDFGSALGVFGTSSELVDYDKFPDVVRQRYQWLLLFPTHKMSLFPRLKEVKMVEARPISNHKMIKWGFPMDLVEVTEKANIDMDIQICRHEAEKPEWPAMVYRGLL